MTTLLTGLSDHIDPGHHGAWWFFGPLLWILTFFLIIGLIRGIFWRRHRRHWHHYAHQNSARSVLAERFARGEIDEQEYRQRLAVLDKPNG